jgi:hypothetical protein
VTARIIERGIWWWIVNAPGGAWHGYPFPSRSDAEESLQMRGAP